MTTDEREAPSTLAEALVSEDYCPKCLGELDTGWECNSCGYDAMSIAIKEQS